MVYTYKEPIENRRKGGKDIQYIINENNCWICISHAKQKHRRNYPVITRKNKLYRLSRYIYECENGDIPEKLFIMHKCDNPECINPNHLMAGTPKENTQDMISKGRKPVGEDIANSKLKEEQVREIRKDIRSLNEIAKAYNVSKKLILSIKQNKTWKHIN